MYKLSIITFWEIWWHTQYNPPISVNEAINSSPYNLTDITNIMLNWEKIDCDYILNNDSLLVISINNNLIN